MLALPLSPEALVEEVVRDHPRAAGFLRRYDVVCLRCGEPAWGTLRELIAARGLDVDRVVAALNEHLAGPAPGPAPITTKP